MVTITSLWLAILLSAVLVWIASALVWMVFPHHKTDWKKLPDEEGARRALKGVPPGQYSVPWAGGMEAMKNPEFMKKYQEGPNAFITFTTPMQSMGKPMAQVFVFFLVVSIVVAYVTSRTLDPGAAYLQVFRVAGTTAWIAHGFAQIPESIWFGRPWSATFKGLGDGLLYALLTAGVFGWRWPEM